jgi:hypothetical protein
MLVWQGRKTPAGLSEPAFDNPSENASRKFCRCNTPRALSWVLDHTLNPFIQLMILLFDSFGLEPPSEEMKVEPAAN